MFKKCFRDLGITASTPLSFNTHIDSIVAKAYRRLGLINKVFYNKSQASTLKLFKAFVRPIVDFSCVIWNPHTKYNIEKIERVQRRMCRCIPSIKTFSYRDQLSYLGIFSLETRRIRFQLIIIFKMFKNIINLNFDNFFHLVPNKRTRGHSASISIKHSNNNYRRDFFSVSSIELWNMLPESAIGASTVTQFKSHLDSFLNKRGMW